MKANLKSPYLKLVLQVLPILIAILLLAVLRWAEYAFFPVVKDFHLTSIERVDNYIVMQGYMRKVRDCRYVGVSAEGTTPSGRVDLPLRFLDSAIVNDNTTRPQGTQNWGPWRVVIPIVPNINTVVLYSVHSCHPAWETTTELARLPLLAVQKETE
jgi:hypothetical protein